MRKHSYTQTWVIFIQGKKFPSLKVSLRIGYSDRKLRLILPNDKRKLLAFRECMTLEELGYILPANASYFLDKVRIIISSTGLSKPFGLRINHI